MKPTGIFVVLLSAVFGIACNNNQSSSNSTNTDSTQNTTNSASLKEEDVSYSGDHTTLKGYVVYDQNKKGKRPAVIVVHEWWGMNDYPKMRAKKLAELGYFAMAVDLFGNGKTAEDPKDAEKITEPFYSPTGAEMAKRRIDIFLNNLKKYPEVDTTKIAAIGYCFGGGVVVNVARLGEDLKAVVSFHGGGLTATPAKKELLKAATLICHGDDDKFTSQQEVQEFKKQMDSIGANYEIRHYPNATHAFTNPAATAKGQKYNMPIAYNAAADSASWNDMKAFFNRIFQ